MENLLILTRPLHVAHCQFRLKWFHVFDISQAAEWGGMFSNTCDQLLFPPLTQWMFTHKRTYHTTWRMQEWAVDPQRALSRELPTTLRLNMDLRQNTCAMLATCYLELVLLFALWTELGISHPQHARVRGFLTYSYGSCFSQDSWNNYENMIWLQSHITIVIF